MLGSCAVLAGESRAGGRHARPRMPSQVPLTPPTPPPPPRAWQSKISTEDPGYVEDHGYWGPFNPPRSQNPPRSFRRRRASRTLTHHGTLTHHDTLACGQLEPGPGAHRTRALAAGRRGAASRAPGRCQPGAGAPASRAPGAQLGAGAARASCQPGAGSRALAAGRWRSHSGVFKRLNGSGSAGDRLGVLPPGRGPWGSGMVRSPAARVLSCIDLAAGMLSSIGLAAGVLGDPGLIVAKMVSKQLDGRARLGTSRLGAVPSRRPLVKRNGSIGLQPRVASRCQEVRGGTRGADTSQTYGRGVWPHSSRANPRYFPRRRRRVLRDLAAVSRESEPPVRGGSAAG